MNEKKFAIEWKNAQGWKRKDLKIKVFTLPLQYPLWLPFRVNTLRKFCEITEAQEIKITYSHLSQTTWHDDFTSLRFTTYCDF